MPIQQYPLPQKMPLIFTRLFGLLSRLSWLPSSCALCGKTDANALCHICRQRYFSTLPRRCAQCAHPLATPTQAHRCGHCLKNKPAFDATIVATDYVAPADQLVLSLKFGGKLALAPLLAQMLCDALLRNTHQEIALPSCITAVPLGKYRLQERGFNQAIEIARPLSHMLGIPLNAHLIKRLRDTQSQATLPINQRRHNIRHAFVVPHRALPHIHDHHIGIVDDVITTGETLNELATTLKRHGATRVTNFVFARTLATQ